MSLERLCNKIICFNMHPVYPAKNAGVGGFSLPPSEHGPQLFAEEEKFLASDAEFVEQHIRQRLPGFDFRI
ncbi:MAG: hypothetical protein JNL58_15715 [Planctomyces sp.]|nr:hypothetical protein [Planctomyces sp.]